MPNRLAHEPSPYLQQHANNPVDWYPWGEEALLRAQAEDKPILLSIGYSACHWCHVMEKESFEDEKTAALMNDLFVSIKVDREERPDLDHVYQLVVQLLGRSGGWPLTVFLTPQQKPFFGGTYFPPADRYGMPGFPRLLTAIADAYRGRRGEVEEQGREMTEAIERAATRRDDAAESPPDASLFARTTASILARADTDHGGFGTRPKFPNTMALHVLLAQAVHDGDDAAALCVRRALDGMRSGGIWDQLGGGFHRYSTDEKWLVPHFEKMLYDEALLLGLYVDAARGLREPRYEVVAKEIVRYLAREMVDPEGGIYATQDADSEGVEGKFFVWTKREVEEVLRGDSEALGVALAAYGVTGDGNFEEHPQPGAHVLFEAKKPYEIARERKQTVAEVEASLERARGALFAVRERRPKPFRDEKILASWNGLAISALAECGAAFDDAVALGMAKRAYAFVKRTLVTPGGRVLRLIKGGVTRGPGFLDDHAYVARAALSLYDATGEPSYIQDAKAVADAIRARFGDPSGGFFFTPDDGEALLVRANDPYDQAVPSGVAVACDVLLRLGGLIGGDAFGVAESCLLSLAPRAAQQPMGFGATLGALDRVVRGSVDVVLVGKRDDPRTRMLARAVFARWIPNRTVAWLDPSDAASVAACSALADGKVTGPDGTPAAYVCVGRSCSLPAFTPEALDARFTRT